MQLPLVAKAFFVEGYTLDQAKLASIRKSIDSRPAVR